MKTGIEVRLKTVQIKVMTFNIHHGMGLDKRLDLDRISKLIQSSEADLIGLNEVDNRFSKRSLFSDQAAQLAKTLDMDYVFGSAIKVGQHGASPRQYGNALVSRFPIINTVNHPFDFLPGLIEDRALLEANVDIGNRLIAIFVAHLSFAPLLHQKQTEFILKKVQRNKNLSIVMGDWNMKPFSRSWRLVTRHLKDVDSFESKNDTYPSRRPSKKLDFIFTSEQIEVIEASVCLDDILASDHLPYMATLNIK
ncbi:endonuclease/exonuclease/phosphatase family protein [Bacillus sp. REN3]|uniref:endonuclease/exonuclease/phosphatase family protein n=1 Tax=Bacillus sp. REN3 TaxID=2802440 RepID=UPI001FEFE7F5|nr:endonuclease/exonuclease/phosphatase family protein [Bacillus sp. REN3]